MLNAINTGFRTEGQTVLPWASSRQRGIARSPSFQSCAIFTPSGASTCRIYKYNFFVYNFQGGSIYTRPALVDRLTVRKFTRCMHESVSVTFEGLRAPEPSGPCPLCRGARFGHSSAMFETFLYLVVQSFTSSRFIALLFHVVLYRPKYQMI